MDIKKAMERNRLEKTNSLLGGFGLEKGKPAAMGEERVHGGVKVKKTAQGWVPVGSGKEKATPEKKTAPGTKKPDTWDYKDKSKVTLPVDGPTVPEDKLAGRLGAKPGAAPGQTNQQPQVGGHEIAQLTHIKTVLKTDPAKAYEIYQSLTPEAQAVVPQEIVNQLVATAHAPVAEDKVDFKDLGKKPAEKKAEVKKEKLAEKTESKPETKKVTMTQGESLMDAFDEAELKEDTDWTGEFGRGDDIPRKVTAITDKAKKILKEIVDPLNNSGRGTK